MKKIIRIFTLFLCFFFSSTFAAQQPYYLYPAGLSFINSHNVENLELSTLSKHPKIIEQNTLIIEKWCRQSNLQLPPELIDLIIKKLSICKRDLVLLLNDKIIATNSKIKKINKKNNIPPLLTVNAISYKHNFRNLHIYFTKLNQITYNYLFLHAEQKNITNHSNNQLQVLDMSKNTLYITCKGINKEITDLNERVYLSEQYHNPCCIIL